MRKDKIDATKSFTVVNRQISTVSQKPDKSNWRWYDSSMKHTRRRLETVELLPGLLNNSRSRSVSSSRNVAMYSREAKLKLPLNPSWKNMNFAKPDYSLC